MLVFANNIKYLQLQHMDIQQKEQLIIFHGQIKNNVQLIQNCIRLKMELNLTRFQIDEYIKITSTAIELHDSKQELTITIIFHQTLQPIEQLDNVLHFRQS